MLNVTSSVLSSNLTHLRLCPRLSEYGDHSHGFGDFIAGFVAY